MDREKDKCLSYTEVRTLAKTMTEKSEAMDQRLMKIASRTWDAIGCDCLVDSNGKPDESVTMKRNDVISIVQDADHMFSYGGDTEAYAYFWFLWEKFPKHLNKVMKQAFPYKLYGW